MLEVEEVYLEMRQGEVLNVSLEMSGRMRRHCAQYFQDVKAAEEVCWHYVGIWMIWDDLVETRLHRP